MRKLYKLVQAYYWVMIFFLCCLLSPNNSAAQQLRISDFVLFGGNASCPTGNGQTPCNAPGCAVQIGSSSNINGGSIGSYKLVKSTGSATITANIYSGGTVQLANSNAVSGMITAANSQGLTSTILSVGSNASLGGNIDVKGNIIVSGGTVSGRVTHPTGTTYSGPLPGGGNITGTPSLPMLPDMPAITSFPAFGTTDITSSCTITPGVYKNVNLNGNRTVTLSGPGIYVFKSIKNSGNTNNFVFNFQNTTTGNFLIYIHGDVDLNKVKASMINGGSATRIYSETHGTGSGNDDHSVAWVIANGSSGSNTTKWLGSVWSPYAAIDIGSGSGSSEITGALWSGTQVNIQSSVTINYAPFQLCITPTANAGPDQIKCQTTPSGPTSFTMAGSATHGTTQWSVFSSTGTAAASITTPGSLSSAVGVSGFGTVTLRLTTTSNISASCGTATDDVVLTVNGLPNADAGPDKVLEFSTLTTLGGSSTTTGVNFNWQAIKGGVITPPANAATITVSAAGTYILTVTSTATTCFANDTAIVRGKNNNLIGSELQSVFQNFNPNTPPPPSPFFILQDGYITIDVIAIENKYADVLALLQGPNYGLTGIVSNGASNFIITGKFPVVNLPKLNLLDTLINFCRPYYQAFNNSGLVTSAGDTTMRSYLLRSGYKLDGDGIKVGVISDSYATITAGTTTPFITNTAAQDVANGDLPGDTTFSVGGHVVNPNGYTKNVHIIKDFPVQRSDEGRAMLQIVHDIAPGAELYFRTGFFTAGDFAKGIEELKDQGCNIIVDDVTYITEPFLKDGVVANTVDAVANQGVTYFSAAGNFGNSSYEKNFTPVPAPALFPGKMAHDFGGGDVLQHVRLAPGNYTIVLQWLDDIYSVGETGGTKNDLDVYLTPYNNSSALIGFNRNNLSGDPIEIAPFTIPGTDSIDYNILIVNNTTTSNPSRIKYIVFRGGMRIMEYNEGTSTLVGQANAAGAIAVGAARFDKAPPYLNQPVIESFSSVGGTSINGSLRLKPDLVAPDVVNTTVRMGLDYVSVNIPGSVPDGYSNFAGTSAAAPHAAAVAALIMQGKKKFLGQNTTSPSEIRSLLQASAVDMETSNNLSSSKFDYISGYGLIDGDSAMRTFAAPAPVIDSLIVPANVRPGETSFTLKVAGSNLSSNSLVYFKDSALASTIVLNKNEITAVIPQFEDNPAITVRTPQRAGTNGRDGGSSDSLYFYDADISVTAVSLTKKYGQQLPALDTIIKINGVLMQDTTLTLADLGLANMTLTTAATANSNVGTYLITSARIFDQTNADDIALLKKYNYSFKSGTLTVGKMPLKITPEDKTITYGQHIGDVTFRYEFDQTNVPDPAGILNLIQAYHRGYLPNNALAVVKDFSKTQANGSVLTAADLTNLNMIASFKAVNNSRKFRLENNKLVPLTDPNTFDVQYLVDVASESIFNYNNDPAKARFYSVFPGIHSKAMLNAGSLANNTGKVELANGSLVQMVNGSLVQMVNGATGPVAPIVNGSLVQIVNGSLVQLVNGEYVPIANGSLVQMINGSLVQLVNGEFVPLANGSLVQLVNGSLVQMVNGSLVQLINGSLVPIINGSLVQLVNGSLVQLVNGQYVPIPNGSLVQLINGSLVQMVNGSLVQLVNGSLVQLVNGSLVQLINGSLVQLVNSSALGTGSSNSNTAVILDEADVDLQTNWIGPMFGINMITGLNAGQQKLVPGVLVNENFDISYGLGNVNIQPVAIAITPNANQSKVYGNADPIFTYTASAALNTGDSYSGTLSRIAGKNVGTYAYTLGTLSAGANYTLTLGGANTFAITARPITITPTVGQSKVYGNADPIFTYTASEALQSGDYYSGALSRIAGNNAGVYAYTPGTLTAGINYTLTLAGTNKFTITNAPLTVKANDKVIFKGDPLPTAASTVTITGLKNGENPTPGYSLSPSCVGAPGVYTIIPSLSNFANSVNYTITYTNGKLYINPKGPGADDVDTYLDCVEDRGASYLPQNRRYIAHFYSKNTNSTPVYVPIGADNKLSSTGSFDGSQQPVLFLPGYGTTRFNVPFDGVSLKWELRTYEGYTKVLETATASASSTRNCYYSYTSARVAGTNTTTEKVTDPGEPANTEIVPGSEVNVFPNPATDGATIYMANELISGKGSLLVDAYGRSQPVKIVRQISEHAFEIDLTRLASGIYFIRVKTAGGYKTVRFVKEK